MIEIKIPREYFTDHSPMLDLMLSAKLQLTTLGYKETITNTYNSYYGTHPIAVNKLVYFSTAPGLEITSDQYYVAIDNPDTDVPFDGGFPNDQLNVTEEVPVYGEDENGEQVIIGYNTQNVMIDGEPVMRQKTWREYTQILEGENTYYALIAYCLPDNHCVDDCGDTIQRLYWNHFGLDKVLERKDLNLLSLGNETA